MHRTLSFFTAGVLVLLLIPQLVRDGMFLDGVTYSAISRHLAEGIGTIWKPHFSNTFFPVFNEHPPLVFALQSLFFELLGNGMYTERIYTFSTALLTAWGIVLCWRVFHGEKDMMRFSWMPVLIWIITPVVFWSYRNNMLENTLSVFTMLSVYFIGKGLKRNKQIFPFFTASFFIVAAFLSKGFTGLFPMIAPVIYGITLKKKEEAFPWGATLLILFLPGLILLLLFFAFPGLEQNIDAYLQQQLIPALQNKREVTTDNRFLVLFQLLTELAVPLLLTLLLMLREGKRSVGPRPDIVWFFLLVGLSASLPLMVTLKQRGFYLLPSIPFFAMAFASVYIPYVQRFFLSLSGKVLFVIRALSLGLFGLTLVLVLVRWGGYSRDEEMLEDVYRLSAYIPEGSILSAEKRKYYLLRKGSRMLESIENYKEEKLELNKYWLLSEKRLLDKKALFEQDIGY